MKKQYIIALVVIVLLVIVVATLFGKLRKRETLSNDEVSKLKQVSKNATATIDITDKSTLSQLWEEHVFLTREVLVAEFNNDSTLQSKVDALLKNQEDIGNYLEKFYSGSSAIIIPLLKEHITGAKDILDDLKYKRISRTVSDINKWYNNGDQVSEAFKSINPDWDLKHHFNKHLEILEQAVLAEFFGFNKTSINIYNKKVVPQAQEMADIIYQGLVNDFNNK